MGKTIVNSGPPISIKMEFEGRLGFFEMIGAALMCNIPNMLIASLIGLGIYASGQWLGGQM